MDVVVPGTLFAQGIARWGNFFNQELFLYESIWDVLGGFVALWLSRRRLDRLRDGALASFWMVWYGGGRLALESLGQGWDWTLPGIPTAILIGAALIALGVGTIIWRYRGGRGGVAQRVGGPR